MHIVEKKKKMQGVMGALLSVCNMRSSFTQFRWLWKRFLSSVVKESIPIPPHWLSGVANIPASREERFVFGEQPMKTRADQPKPWLGMVSIKINSAGISSFRVRPSNPVCEQVGDDPRSTYVRCLRVVRRSRVGVRQFRVVLWTYTFPSS